MADTATITVTLGVTDTAVTATLGSCDPTAYADATITEWRAGEVMNATLAGAIDIFAASASVADCSLVVTNLDAANDVTLTWTDASANANTQDIPPLRTVVISCDPTVAPTVQGNVGDCLCMIAFASV